MVRSASFQELNRLWLRGGFPPAWLAKKDGEATLWTESFVRSFLERDLPELGVRVASTAMRRFWTMLAHWQGQSWNSSVFARSFGVADTTVRRYLDILTGALVVRQFPPHQNRFAILTLPQGESTPLLISRAAAPLWVA